MIHRQSPEGWDEQRVQDIIARYGSVSEPGQAAESDAPVKLTAEAIRVLCREIGLANTARVVQRMTGVCGSYTEERDAIIGDITMEEALAEIKRLREAQPPPAEKAPE